MGELGGQLNLMEQSLTALIGEIQGCRGDIPMLGERLLRDEGVTAFLERLANLQLCDTGSRRQASKNDLYKDDGLSEQHRVQKRFEELRKLRALHYKN